MKRLNFENFVFAKMKKSFDFTFHLLLQMISQVKSIHQTLRLNNFKLFVESNWLEIWRRERPMAADLQIFDVKNILL